MKPVLLIVNTGTPPDPGRRSVRKYLSEFLNDPLVMDMPWLFRKLLVNLVIVPFRSSHSSKLYRQLWTDEGSPLLVNTRKLRDKLRDRLPEWEVTYAMRYGEPSLRKFLDDISRSTVNKITILPMYPQYATSTTGSVQNLVMKRLSSRSGSMELRFIEQFYNEQGFINAAAHRIRQFHPGNFDHLLFSYHGLPVRHIQKMHPGNSFSRCTCHISFPDHGKKCYKAQCYETSRLIASDLGLQEGSWSVSFQSRMSRGWTGPFTNEILKKLAGEGKKKVLVAAPSFTADCLETILEIGVQYRELFMKAGGTELVFSGSLNDDDSWADAITSLVSRGEEL